MNTTMDHHSCTNTESLRAEITLIRFLARAWNEKIDLIHFFEEYIISKVTYCVLICLVSVVGLVYLAVQPGYSQR
jgi:hypothetical protein